MVGCSVKALGFTKVALWANLHACDSTNTEKIQNFLDAQLSFKEGVSDVNVNCSVFNMGKLVMMIQYIVNNSINSRGRQGNSYVLVPW